MWNETRKVGESKTRTCYHTQIEEELRGEHALPHAKLSWLAEQTCSKKHLVDVARHKAASLISAFSRALSRAC